MKCPMLTMYATTYRDPEEYRDRDCLKDDCAWWDTTFEWCSEQTKAHELHALRVELQELKQKMPPARE